MGKQLLFSFIFLLNLAFGTNHAFSQTSPDTLKQKSDSSTVIDLKVEPEYAEVLAEFPGGEKALYEFIIKNLVYPEEAKKLEQSGKVYVQFVILEDGSIDQNSVKVKRGEFELLNQAAINVIKSLPKWKPGTMLGKPVKTNYILPIIFKL